MADTALLSDLTTQAASDGVQQFVVGAMIEHDGKILLLKRPASEFMGGIWELPSGKVEPGETLDTALIREITEETGLHTVTIGPYLGHFDYQSATGKRSRQFTFTATASGTVTLTEHEASQWTPLDLAPELVTEEVARVIAAH
jgi:8-oxo-dGTP diphosphatase